MIPAPLPDNEAQRLQALHDLDILDTLEEQAYDDITWLTAQICNTPIALVTLIDAERQFLKSRHGLDAEEVPRDIGFCPHAILDDDVLVVEDATQDERFHDNPLVHSGPNVKFYAGAPLVLPGNLRIGTLCVVDHEPRELTAEQEKTLKVLARQVVSQLTLRKTVRELESANQTKSDFLSAMSHELRTPLNAILGFGQLLDLNPDEPLTTGQKGCVDYIVKSGQHLLDLINDILDLAQIEAGRVELSIEDISPSKVIDDCLSMVSALAQGRNIQIAIDNVTGADVLVRADHVRLKQVLLNLISNAIKYNREDGHIRITADRSGPHMLRLNVTDTGQGIPADQMDDLFKPFNRLGAETTDIEGTGIGLVVSKDLVELMGGAIGVQSTEGKGSTFWVDLPLAETKMADKVRDVQSAAAVKSRSPSVDLSGKLLYVEDNPDNLILMDMIVEHIDGLSMISAHTAELGIELARQERPDVIILDINLPGMSGLDAVKTLRGMSETQTTPILALSAAATQGDIKKGLAAGFDHYMTKPIQVAELIKAIQGALDN